MTWAEQELGDASLGDARLSRRLVKLATRLAESPEASIPQACRGWAEMRAAYRFLAQDQLDCGARQGSCRPCHAANGCLS